MIPEWSSDAETADRLIALGWVRLDEERLARALDDALSAMDDEWIVPELAAAIIRALREEES